MPTNKEVEPVYRAFGARIEMLRRTLGMNQMELAKKVRMSRGSIANIETGRQRILLADVDKFAESFGISPRQLLKGIYL